MAPPRILEDARGTSCTRSIFQWQKGTYMMPDILHAQVHDMNSRGKKVSSTIKKLMSMSETALDIARNDNLLVISVFRYQHYMTYLRKVTS
jgi:hypothetical protein